MLLLHYLNDFLLVDPRLLSRGKKSEGHCYLCVSGVGGYPLLPTKLIVLPPWWYSF